MSSDLSLNIPGCKNGTVVESVQGLNYTIFCGYDITSHDMDNTVIDNLEDCINDCTKRGPQCAGVSWVLADMHCFRKSRDASFIHLVPGVSPMISALAFKSQFEQKTSDLWCPYPNLSKNKMSSGREYKILCGAYYGSGEVMARLHVRTMEECMRHCDDMHPLCGRVNFNAAYTGMGWMNCALMAVSTTKPSWFTRDMAHAAEAVTQRPPKLKCENDTVRIASDGRTFKVSCDDRRDLNSTSVLPLRTSHEESLDDCNKRCTGANFTCKTAAFDYSLRFGYQNCYLFDGFPPPSGRDLDHTFIYLATLSTQYQPPPLGPKAAQKRWIAGAVLGPVGFVALVMALILWHCKYKPKGKRKIY